MKSFITRLSTWLNPTNFFSKNRKAVHSIEGVDDEFVQKLDWTKFDDYVARSLRKSIKIMTGIFPFVFMVPIIPNYVRYFPMGWEALFWVKLVIRIVLAAASFYIFFLCRSSKPLNYQQMIKICYSTAFIWMAFWCSLVISSFHLQPPGSEALPPEAQQTFYGSFSGICLIGIYFPLGFAPMFKMGVFMTTAFLVTNAYIGIISPIWMVLFALFNIGATILVSLGARNSDRLRREDFVLRSRLAENNEKLKEMDTLKTRFFANISHELRTPLTMILAPLDRILSGQESASLEYLNSVGANARRLLRQVNLILDFSKIEAGKMSVSLTTANLGNLLQEVVSAARPHASRAGIIIETIGLDSLPASDFDVDKLETIASNLISNAIKFRNWSLLMVKVLLAPSFWVSNLGVCRVRVVE